jgi:hypothetical protein
MIRAVFFFCDRGRSRPIVLLCYTIISVSYCKQVEANVIMENAI